MQIFLQRAVREREVPDVRAYAGRHGPAVGPELRRGRRPPRRPLRVQRVVLAQVDGRRPPRQLHLLVAGRRPPYLVPVVVEVRVRLELVRRVVVALLRPDRQRRAAAADAEGELDDVVLRELARQPRLARDDLGAGWGEGRGREEQAARRHRARRAAGASRVRRWLCLSRGDRGDTCRILALSRPRED